MLWMGLEQSNATVLWTVAQPRLDGADSIRGPTVRGHESHHPYKDPGLAVRGCCRDRPSGRSAAVRSGRVRRTHAVGGHIYPPYEDGALIEHPVGDGFQPSRPPSDDRHGLMVHTSVDAETRSAGASPHPTKGAAFCESYREHTKQPAVFRLPAVIFPFYWSFIWIRRAVMERARFSFWTRTSSGTVSCTGAKFQIALMPHSTSRSQISWALSAGTVMMPMVTA